MKRFIVKELAHKIREIEKSDDLPMASSRPRNACDVIQCECKGLRHRREDDENEEQQGRKWMSQLSNQA